MTTAKKEVFNWLLLKNGYSVGAKPLVVVCIGGLVYWGNFC